MSRIALHYRLGNWLAKRAPAVARHPLARALRVGGALAFGLGEGTHAMARRAEAVSRDLGQFFLQTAKLVDVQAPCPHCGQPAPLCDLKALKTYCFGCSDFGLDPRIHAGSA
jgi:hypothetical protein